MPALMVANLRDADLRYANLDGANLIHADLNGANLISVNLKITKLTNAATSAETRWPDGFDRVAAGVVWKSSAILE